MNKKFITAIFVCLNIALSTAIFPSMRSGFNVMAEIKQLDDSDFGKKLLDTIALQLGNKAPLEDVAKLLSDLKANLHKQNEDHLALHLKQAAECKADIADYNARIEHATNEIKDATINIGNLRNAIKQLKAAILNKETQLQILASRRSNLVRDHAADVANFERRSKEHTEVIAALDIIIPRLEGIRQNPQTQKQVFAELAKIGTTNPIQALVEVASTFDPAALENVINKLKEIRESLAKSLKDDQDAQEKAAENYDRLLKEIDSVTGNLTTGLKEDRSALAENESNLADEQSRLEQNQKEFKAATAGLHARTKECNAQERKWKDDTAQRNKEINVIEKVQEILATRLQSMRGYLKKRVNKD